MDKSVPAAAALILNKIGSIEAPEGYNTVYGNAQKTSKYRGRKPLTEYTIDELIADQQNFTKEFGSSASGKYQIMRKTLIGLKKKLKLSGKAKFDANMQDRLAYDLLKQRGYTEWADGIKTNVQFALGIAQEWASFPVLEATQGAHRKINVGQSYYAGDGMNKALIPASAVLDMLQGSRQIVGQRTPASKPVLAAAAVATGTAGAAAGYIPTSDGQTSLQGFADTIATARPIVEAIQYVGTLPIFLIGLVAIGGIGYGIYKWKNP